MAYSDHEEMVDYSGDISDQEMPAADNNPAPTTSVDSLPVLLANVREGIIRERGAASKLPPQYQPWVSVVSNQDADETLEMTKVAHLPAFQSWLLTCLTMQRTFSQHMIPQTASAASSGSNSHTTWSSPAVVPVPKTPCRPSCT